MTSIGEQIADANVRHEANYGFQLHETGQGGSGLCESATVREAFAGLVFRIRRTGRAAMAPWAAIREIGAMGEALRYASPGADPLLR